MSVTLTLAALIGGNIAFLLGLYGLSKRYPHAFTRTEAPPELVPQELVERWLPPAPPTPPDLSMPSSLKTDLEALLIEKQDWCTQYNHSCDVCPRNDLTAPSRCVYDARLLTTIDQQAETFDTRMGSLIGLMQRNEILAVELNDKLTDANEIMDEQTYIKRRFFYTVLFGAVNLAFNVGLWTYLWTFLQGVIP